MTLTVLASQPQALMTIAETAAYLGKPTSTVYEWVRRGELPAAAQINGRWYVRRAALDRWLADDGAAAATA